MFQSEITFLLGIGVAVFILLNRGLLSRLPRFRLLVVAYALLVVAWGAANGEGLRAESPFWADAFKLGEHLCYLASSVLMAVWCWAALYSKRSAQP